MPTLPEMMEEMRQSPIFRKLQRANNDESDDNNGDQKPNKCSSKKSPMNGDNNEDLGGSDYLEYEAQKVMVEEEPSEGDYSEIWFDPESSSNGGCSTTDEEDSFLNFSY